MLMNTTQNGNNWLKLTLEGTDSNWDAIGARVTLDRTDGHTIIREVKAGGSYQSTSSKSLYFGLAESGVKELLIRWPSGYIQIFDEMSVNETVHIKEERKELAEGKIHHILKDKIVLFINNSFTLIVLLEIPFLTQQKLEPKKHQS